MSAPVANTSATVANTSAPVANTRTQIQRVSEACGRCKTKKCKCDGMLPCERCKRDDVQCSYEPEEQGTKVVRIRYVNIARASIFAVGLTNFHHSYLKHLEKENIVLKKAIQLFQRGTQFANTNPETNGSYCTHNILLALGLTPHDKVQNSPNLEPGLLSGTPGFYEQQQLGQGQPREPPPQQPPPQQPPPFGPFTPSNGPQFNPSQPNTGLQFDLFNNGSTHPNMPAAGTQQSWGLLTPETAQMDSMPAQNGTQFNIPQGPPAQHYAPWPQQYGQQFNMPITNMGIIQMGPAPAQPQFNSPVPNMGHNEPPPAQPQPQFDTADASLEETLYAGLNDFLRNPTLAPMEGGNPFNSEDLNETL